MIINNRIQKISSLCAVGAIVIVANKEVVFGDDLHNTELNVKARLGIETSITGRELSAGGLENETYNSGRIAILSPYSSQMNAAATCDDKDIEGKDSKANNEEAVRETQSTKQPVQTPDPYSINGINYQDYIDYEKYENLGIVKISDSNNLNVRSGAGEGYEVIGKMTQKAGCTVLGKAVSKDGDTWYKIKSGDVNGYVIGKYLITGEKAQEMIPAVGKLMITSTADSLNVRQKPSKESEILDSITKGEQLEIKSVKGDWIEVAFDTGGDTTGYVSGDYVKISFVIKTAVKLDVDSGESTSSVRSQLVAYAELFLGNPYVYGGTSLTNGIDCSGFTMKVYQKFGISLPHNSGSQSGYGTRVSISQVRPGDLVFYGRSGISHVAIYIGNNKIIHASNPSDGIKISNMYYSTPVKAITLLD